ncbi:MAG TPA: 4'-phosphopantetheinyl transferase superfamily protein [Terriglobales bacterium]
MQLTGELPPSEAHVWLANLDLDDVTISRISRLLNADEQSRATRFKVDDARNQFIVSRGLLRMVLGKYLKADPTELAFRAGPQGKPELAQDGAIDFNLSHTRSLVAIAVTHAGAIGVDVERIRENVDSLQLAERYFSKQEFAWVRSHSVSKRAAAFFSCWTAKEAYIKALGGGLSIPLDGFAIVPDATKSELQLEVPADPDASANWTLRRLQLPADFRGAAAVHFPDCHILTAELSI